MFRTRTKTARFMPKRVSDALQANFDRHELEQLARLGTPVTLAAGTTLMTQGALGRQALVIVDGTASVLRNGESIATVGPGDIVGEISLLSGEHCVATVVADTELAVYALSPREFASLMARCPQLESRVAGIAVRRLART